MSIQTFEAVLEKPEDIDTLFIRVPFSVPEVWGAKGLIRVCGTIDDIPFRKAADQVIKRLGQGAGGHAILLDKSFRATLGKKAGDTVQVVVKPDDEPRTVDIPDDFATALTAAHLLPAFERLAYTHRKEYVVWINDAKKIETRNSRIEKAIHLIMSKK